MLVEINRDGFMTQLGVVWNMDLNNDKQLEDLVEKLKEVGARIVRYQGRVGDKVMALENCLRSTISYRMQYCVWGIEEYEKLDKTYTEIIRKITRNMRGYPSSQYGLLRLTGA